MRPSSAFVPSRRTTIGSVDLHPVERLEDAARDLVAARDPAEDVEEDRLDLRVARDHLERVDDAFGVAAAAEVAEVRGAAAGHDDDVDRRHREARAVAEDPDVAVELHVDDALLARERLERVGCARVAELGDVRVAVERAVVDGELRVERLDHAVGRDDQRVDLGEHRVALDEAAVELPDDVRDLLLLARILDTGAVDEATRDPRLEAFERIDVQANERVGVVRGDLFDLDAALRREHEQRLLDAAVERDREVVLLRDVGRALDPDLLDDVAANVEADDLLGLLLRVRRVVGELHAAGLAAAAREHLSLDDDRAADLLRGLPGLLRRRRQTPLGDGDPELLEELLALVLVKVHRPREHS